VVEAPVGVDVDDEAENVTVASKRDLGPLPPRPRPRDRVVVNVIAPAHLGDPDSRSRLSRAADAAYWRRIWPLVGMRRPVRSRPPRSGPETTVTPFFLGATVRTSIKWRGLGDGIWTPSSATASGGCTATCV